MDDIPLDSLVPTKSKYLTKDDVTETGVVLTIRGFKMETVGQGNDADERCILYFTEEDYKPMVVNKTNMQRIKHVTGAETTAQARGKQVCVYNDPMIEYGGKLTGGVRIKPLPESGLNVGRKPRSDFEGSGMVDDDDIPF